jgi:hypothetical protein
MAANASWFAPAKPGICESAAALAGIARDVVAALAGLALNATPAIPSTPAARRTVRRLGLDVDGAASRA